MGKRSTSRKLAMQALYQYQIQKDNRKYILEYTLAKDDYIEKTKEFATLIYNGILDNDDLIVGLIKEHAIDWKFDRIAGIDKAIIKVGLWELLYTDTSVKVIIAESIELIRKYSVFEAIKFVNGILGAIANKREALKEKIGVSA